MGMVVGFKSKKKKMSTSSTNFRPPDEFLASYRWFMLYSRSLPHRLGRGSWILSSHERDREGVQDTPSWVAGPRVGAGGDVVVIATVGVEAARAAARTRSRRPSGRQRH
jgi:hypothetical protein